MPSSRRHPGPKVAIGLLLLIATALVLALFFWFRQRDAAQASRERGVDSPPAESEASGGASAD